MVPVYHAGQEAGELYITMRYVEGTDLRTLLLRSGRLDHRRAAGLVVQIGAALDAAHALGLVHRDVKPGNVLVGQLHGRDQAYLTDFGLTKRLASGGGLTRTGEWVGTVDYVAPEQIAGGTVDARADVYALGCILYHALTGRVPYDRDFDVAKIYAHLNEPPPSVTQVVPDVPAELDAVVARGMAKDPAERYGSASELGWAALAAAERDVTAPPSPSETVQPAIGVTGQHVAPTPGGILEGEEIVDPPKRERSGSNTTTTAATQGTQGTESTQGTKNDDSGKADWAPRAGRWRMGGIQPRPRRQVRVGDLSGGQQLRRRLQRARPRRPAPVDGDAQVGRLHTRGWLLRFPADDADRGQEARDRRPVRARRR